MQTSFSRTQSSNNLSPRHNYNAASKKTILDPKNKAQTLDHLIHSIAMIPTQPISHAIRIRNLKPRTREMQTKTQASFNCGVEIAHVKRVRTVTMGPNPTVNMAPHTTWFL